MPEAETSMLLIPFSPYVNAVRGCERVFDVGVCIRCVEERTEEEGHKS